MSKAPKGKRGVASPLTQPTPCKTHTFEMTNVVDSRKEGEILKRRRRCKQCGLLIHTEEKIISYGSKKQPHRNGYTVGTPTAPPKPKKKRKAMPLLHVEPDFDKMTDDEIEEWITSGKEYYNE